MFGSKILEGFPLSQLILNIIYKNIKVCQELGMSFTRILEGKGPIKSSRVFQNIIHLDPGVLIASNISNNSSLVNFDYGYGDQSYTNSHHLALKRQCGFSCSKQVSTVTQMHAPAVSPTTFLSWLYQQNSLQFLSACTFLGDSIPFKSVFRDQ